MNSRKWNFDVELLSFSVNTLSSRLLEDVNIKFCSVRSTQKLGMVPL